MQNSRRFQLAAGLSKAISDNKLNNPTFLKCMALLQEDSSSTIGGSIVLDCLETGLRSVTLKEEIMLATLTATVTNLLLCEYLFVIIKKTLTETQKDNFLFKLKRPAWIQGDLFLGSASLGTKQAVSKAVFHPDHYRQLRPAFKLYFNTTRQSEIVKVVRTTFIQVSKVIRVALVNLFQDQPGSQFEIYQRGHRTPCLIRPRFEKIPMSSMPLAMSPHPLKDMEINLPSDTLASTISIMAVDKLRQYPWDWDPTYMRAMTLLVNRKYLSYRLIGEWTGTLTSMPKGSKRKVKIIADTIKAANTLKKEIDGEAHYDTISVDSRGRLYPLSIINSTSAKPLRNAIRIGRGHGKPLGKVGLDYLLRGIASAWGWDKELNPARLVFAKDNIDLFSGLGYALSSPCNALVLKGLNWLLNAEASDGTNCDSPFVVMSLCIELAKAQQWVAAGNLMEDFVSHCGIQIDATCSGPGLQGLLLHSYPLANACNCASSGPVLQINDTYRIMVGAMDTGIPALREAAQLGNEVKWFNEDAVLLWDRISDKDKRTVSKGLTMPAGYGCKHKSARKSLEGLLLEKGLVLVGNKPVYEIITSEQGDLVYKIANCLAGIFFHAFKHDPTFAPMSQHEVFEKSISEAFQGEPEWIIPGICGATPTLIKPVYMQSLAIPYRMMTSEGEKTGQAFGLTLGDFRLDSINPDVLEQVDTKASKRAISPSSIHSLDACIMAGIIVKMDTPITITHDCVGALPSEMPALERIIGEVYVELFCGEDILQSWADHTQAKTRFAIQLPEVHRVNKRISPAEISNADHRWC